MKIKVMNNELKGRQNEEQTMEITILSDKHGNEVLDCAVYIPAVDSWFCWLTLSGAAWTKVNAEAEEMMQSYLEENGMNKSFDTAEQFAASLY
jgi:hypothetical protein